MSERCAAFLVLPRWCLFLDGDEDGFRFLVAWVFSLRMTFVLGFGLSFLVTRSYRYDGTV
jgi:hypothetical protein